MAKSFRLHYFKPYLYSVKVSFKFIFIIFICIFSFKSKSITNIKNYTVWHFSSWNRELIKYLYVWVSLMCSTYPARSMDRSVDTEKSGSVCSFYRQKEQEVIIRGRTHLPNKDPPFSGIRLLLSILLDSANGSGSPAQGMFGYFTFIFISSAFAARWRSGKIT